MLNKFNHGGYWHMTRPVIMGIVFLCITKGSGHGVSRMVQIQSVGWEPENRIPHKSKVHFAEMYSYS